jgi:hypothetical protein
MRCIYVLVTSTSSVVHHSAMSEVVRRTLFGCRALHIMINGGAVRRVVASTARRG